MVNYFRARTAQTFKKNITAGLCQPQYLNTRAEGLKFLDYMVTIYSALSFMTKLIYEISSSHSSEYDVQNCLLGCTAV
jgi:hypothetical protein